MRNERLKIGDFVKHFKHDMCNIDEMSNEYYYRIIGFSKHTETGEDLVVYEALYSNDRGVNYGTYCRPYNMFMSEVDKEKYPEAKQKYRFEKIDFDEINSMELELENYLVVITYYELTNGYGCSIFEKNKLTRVLAATFHTIAELINHVENKLK